MGGAYQDAQGIWRTPESNTQTSLDKHVASTFQQVMSLNPTSREANLPPLNPSTKRPQASVTPLSGTPNPLVRSPAQKKACPEKHGNEEAMDKLTKQVGLSITAFEKKPTPPPIKPTPYPIRVTNPQPGHIFAWHLVTSCAIAQQDALRPPELTDDEVQTMKTFGIKKMISAYGHIAEQIPGNYKRSHQYLAEKGIMGRLREMERAI